jgi:hypothetical protein
MRVKVLQHEGAEGFCLRVETEGRVFLGLDAHRKLEEIFAGSVYTPGSIGGEVD